MDYIRNRASAAKQDAMKKSKKEGWILLKEAISFSLWELWTN